MWFLGSWSRSLVVGRWKEGEREWQRQAVPGPTSRTDENEGWGSRVDDEHTLVSRRQHEQGQKKRDEVRGEYPLTKKGRRGRRDNHGGRGEIDRETERLTIEN